MTKYLIKYAVFLANKTLMIEDSYLAGFCTLVLACLLAAPSLSSHWDETPPVQVPPQSLCLCLSSFSSLPAVDMK